MRSVPDPPRIPYFIQDWREATLANYSQAMRDALAQEMERLDRFAPREGTYRLGVLHARLKAAHALVAYSDEAIIEKSEFYARLCRMTAPSASDDERGLPHWMSQIHALARRIEIARHAGIEVFATRRIRFAGLAARLDDPLWWRRQLRKAWTRRTENECRDIGMVHRSARAYVTEEGLRFRQEQRKRGEVYLRSRVVINADGVQLNLFDVSQSTVANPILRRGEMMVRARGFDEIAKGLRHASLFVTLTTPSAFHAHLAEGGRNPKFEGFTPRQGQEWLCKTWARARARLHRLGVRVYGFRVAEPHHDGTPHWHMLLFLAHADVDVVRRELTKYWLADYADESGATEHRIKFKAIDASKGSAVGYIAKYIAKNIDAAGTIGAEVSDETGKAVTTGVSRVEAWASLHGIRQFQQIGGPPVGIWRELRRLREPVKDRDIERARRCADAGSWCMFAYAIACGNPLAGRKTALKLEKESVAERTRYGECRIARVIGLRYCSSVVVTRPGRWKIEKKCGKGLAEGARGRSFRSYSSLGPVGTTVRSRPPEHDPQSCGYCQQEALQWPPMQSRLRI